MATLPLVILHLPFGYGADWSWAAEVMVVATYMAFAIGWDYLWFILNPAYGLRRFRRGGVWWYSGALARPAAVRVLRRRGRIVRRRADRLAVGRRRRRRWPSRGAWSARWPCCAWSRWRLAPAYRRWYRWMRRPEADEHEAVAAAAEREQ